ncbi:MAG: hypothetical protein LW711_05235 [Saprospiraceae bacterium]|jgi:hypothetical protein|nr:hypothetical protein [Saprospiraceae bacterium]MCF8301293.1 hypothetical protein [Haliscomenobacter sp.]
MYKFLAKNGQALAFGVGTLITVIFFAIAAGGLEEFSALPIEEQRKTNIFDFGLIASLGLTVLSVVLLVVFGVFQVATNFKESLLGLIALLVLAGIYFVSMAMASGEVSGIMAATVEKVGGVSPAALKFIDGSITTSLIISTVAILALVLSEIRNFFK